MCEKAIPTPPEIENMKKMRKHLRERTIPTPPEFENMEKFKTERRCTHNPFRGWAVMMLWCEIVLQSQIAVQCF